MSNLRQRRKPTTDADDDAGDGKDGSSSSSSPSSTSSWEKNFDEDNSNNTKNNSNSSYDSNDESNATKSELLAKQVPAPTPTPTPSTLDKFLSTYGSFTASTFTADQGFKILQWSSWAISYATSNSPKHQHALSPSLRKLSNEISLTRYVLRFYGFFQSLEGYRSGSWAGGTWDNPHIGKIAKYLMAAPMLAYYPLEHLAYVGWQMPKLVPTSRVNANRVSAISCVFWTAYIVGDFWVSCLKWKELKRKLGDVGEILTGVKGKHDKEAIAELQNEESTLRKKIRHVKLQLLRCILFILPAANWSLPNWATNPMLDELPLNGLMLVEAYTSVYQSLCSMLG